MLKIKTIIADVHMGLGHEGLGRIYHKKENARVTDLKDGEIVVFINRGNDKIKMLGSKGIVLGYIREPNGRKLMKEAIQYLPQTFGGEGFNYDKACELACAPIDITAILPRYLPPDRSP